MWLYYVGSCWIQIVVNDLFNLTYPKDENTTITFGSDDGFCNWWENQSGIGGES